MPVCPLSGGGLALKLPFCAGDAQTPLLSPTRGLSPFWVPSSPLSGVASPWWRGISALGFLRKGRWRIKVQFRHHFHSPCAPGPWFDWVKVSNFLCDPRHCFMASWSPALLLGRLLSSASPLFVTSCSSFPGSFQIFCLYISRRHNGAHFEGLCCAGPEWALPTCSELDTASRLQLRSYRPYFL